MRTTVLSIVTVAILSACSGGDTASDTATLGDTTTIAPAPAPAAPAVTDPQIAAIVVAANTADIEAGRLASSKSSNAEIKEFGKRMIADHEGVNKAAVALVTKLGVTPEENPTSQQQKTQGEQNLTNLKGMTGVAFDRAYIANEVTYHEGLLSAIDTVLLPSAQNAELKTLLTNTRPAVVSHLEHAKRLQTSLGQS